LWYLLRWVYGEWFGLRRKLYYWYLKRSVLARKPTEELTAEDLYAESYLGGEWA